MHDSQANPSDADQIYSAIYSRAQKLKSSAAVTKQTSPVVSKGVLSTPTSSVDLPEKRSCDSVAGGDPSVAEKRRRSLLVCFFL